jgi:RNA polymerase sigma-70 factor (ECF subfamily)
MGQGPTVVGPLVPVLGRYLVSRCSQRALAEDLTSETFLAAARQRPAGAVSVAWLVGVARHKLADHWRREAREQRLLRAVEAVPPGTEDPWESHLDMLGARQALSEVAPQHRAALTLRYLDGLSVPEVAEVLGRTLGATEALLVRARRDLRRAYLQGGARD